MITKKGISFFIMLTVLMLLVACGDNGNKNVSNSKESSSSADSGSQDEVTYFNEDSLFSDDGPQDGPPGGFTPLSEALKEHTVWLATTVIDESDLTRDTGIGKVYVFDNDEVTYYDYSKVAEPLKIEDAAKMTDEDIVKHSQEFAKKVDLGKYSLDLVLDDTGNSTDYEYLITEKGGKGEHAPNFSTTIMPVNFFGTDFVAIGASRLVIDSLFSGGGFVLTRSEPNTYFQLDDPDTTNSNVTIEQNKK